MKLTTLLLTASLAAADLVVPSNFRYSNTTSTRSPTTIYAYDTEYSDSVFDVTKTICDESGCYVTTDLESLTTYTTEVDGILTTIVTAVPVEATVTEGLTRTRTYNDPEASEAAGGSATIAQTKGSVSTLSPETVTDDTYTTVTLTKCYESKPCYETTEVQSKSVYTTTVDDETTIVTTYCPLETTEATEASTEATTEASVTASVTETPTTVTEISSTVITVTSCSDNKCSAVPVTTGLTVATITIDNVETYYTTYCPLSSEEKTTEKTETTETTSATTVATTSADKTVNVITNNILTQSAKTTVVLQLVTSLATDYSVSVYEGGAGIIRVSGVGLLTLLFMMLA